MTIRDNFIKRFLKEDRGATAIEYAIMASLVAAVIVAVVMSLGDQVVLLFAKVLEAPW